MGKHLSRSSSNPLTAVCVATICLQRHFVSRWRKNDVNQVQQSKVRGNWLSIEGSLPSPGMPFTSAKRSSSRSLYTGRSSRANGLKCGGQLFCCFGYRSAVGLLFEEETCIHERQIDGALQDLFDMGDNPP
jgi:hypothetical protein